MKPYPAVLLAALLAAIVPASARTIVSLDQEWSFYQGEANDAEKPGFADAAWQKIGVPHDWSIAGPFDQTAPATGSGAWLPTGVAWYRKEITLPAESKGKRVWVEFDGVMANSDVWLNGQLLGHRPSGYVSFRYDLTDQLKPDGSNILAVRADTFAQPASRWYAGSGIYQYVRLAILRATAPGKITLTAKAAGLPPASMELTAP